MSAGYEVRALRALSVYCTYSLFKMVKKQAERDAAVAGLVDALNLAYDVVLAAYNLENASKAQNKAIEELVKQTINCGHFINSYLKQGFCAYHDRVSGKSCAYSYCRVSRHPWHGVVHR